MARTELIKISELLPTDSKLRGNPREYIEILDEVPPITVVYYKRLMQQKRFIVYDGHRRTVASLLDGRDEIMSQILETDEDIRMSNKRYLYSGLKDLLSSYPEWKRACRKNGITCFEDYIRQMEPH